MKNRGVLLITAGVLTVCGVLFFVILVVQGRQTNAPPPRTVIIATRNIPAKTRLTPAMFAAVQRPADQVEPSAITSVSSVLGSVSQDSIADGTIVTIGELVPESSLGLAVQLRPGMRAVSIAVDPVKDVSDLLHPGDHVDVIAAPPRASATPAAYTIMKDVRVLSVGPLFATTPTAPAAGQQPGSANNAQQAPPPPVEVRTVTLEVTPTQADMLTMADLNATLRLALRPGNEPASSGFTERIVFGENAPPPTVVREAPSRPAPRARTPFSVPVINGDQISGAK